MFDEELSGDTLSLGTVLGDGVPELGVPDPDAVARLKELANTDVVSGAAVVLLGTDPNGEFSVPKGLLLLGKLPKTFDGLFENILLVVTG